MIAAAVSKNGVSSYEVHRAIGVTQKTAWFMDHRIRNALSMGTINKLSGQIEADEAFIGGKARNMHADKRAERITDTGGKGKTAVMGILDRGGKVITKVVENRKKKALQGEVSSTIDSESSIYPRLEEAFDALKWWLAHRPDSGEVLEGSLRLYKQAGNTQQKVPS